MNPEVHEYLAMCIHTLYTHTLVCYINSGLQVYKSHSVTSNVAIH